MVCNSLLLSAVALLPLSMCAQSRVCTCAMLPLSLSFSLYLARNLDEQAARMQKQRLNDRGGACVGRTLTPGDPYIGTGGGLCSFEGGAASHS